MRFIATLLILTIAVLHFYIAWFEIFAWQSRGPNVFSSFPVELFEPTTAMAANQGVYNAFLAIGLVWSRVIKDAEWATKIATCFLLFVLIAGVFGAATVSVRILIVQAVPALAALVCLLMSRGKQH
ncbi:MAG: DUF1304 domain-containing protein [Pseudoruegeria sp.]